jgi:hypothetical protein
MKRLFGVLLITISLPILAALHQSGNVQPFNPVAIAGHVKPTGEECSCGEPNCVPDYPTECLGGSPQPVDLGGGLLLAALCVAVWLRFKS